MAPGMINDPIEALAGIDCTEVSAFDDAASAIKRITAIYETSLSRLAEGIHALESGTPANALGGIGAYYPMLAFSIPRGPAKIKSTASSGFARRGAGIYLATLTHPEIFADYLAEQIQSVMEAHNTQPLVGISPLKIPLTFGLGGHRVAPEVARHFHAPDVLKIASSNSYPEGFYPLSLYSASQIDMAVERLRHYTGTDPRHFQSYVLLTNYRMYIDMFTAWAKSTAGTNGYTEFIQPDALEEDSQQFSSKKLPQMPAFHLKRDDGLGISVVNIGVGPANAANFAVNVSALRPHALLMVGHCGGLRSQQSRGHYVLGDGYFRDDGVFDKTLPTSVPVPPVAEINNALKQAMADICQLEARDLREILQTGVVASTSFRPWETEKDRIDRIIESRALAIDMESATVATAGFLNRVPYGTLLLVSDLPLHGEIKLQAMAHDLYEKSTERHLRIAVRAVEILREKPHSTHSRKLRDVFDAVFR